MKKTIYLVWATRGDYSDRTEHAVCWRTTEAAAEACVRRMLDADLDGKPLTKTAQIKCVGNSVPPLLAAAVVRAQFPEAA